MSSQLTPGSDSRKADNLPDASRLKRYRSRRWLLILTMLAGAMLSLLSFRDLDVAALPRLLLFTSSTAVAAGSAARGLKGDIWTIIPGAVVTAYIAGVSVLLYLWLFVW